MELKILGPLEAIAEGRVVDIRGQKQRELLAILAIHANEVVSADRLIDELWGETPPASAVKTLQAYVSRLRKALGETVSLTTHGHGYSLSLAAGALDAERFATLLEEGRRALAAGEPDRAVETLDAALALWRGPVLADFTYASFAQPEIARLDELRLAAREERVEADLVRGRHAETIGAARESRRPASASRAPARSAHARAVPLGPAGGGAAGYQEGRRMLAEELGLEPSQSLQRLERQILEHDPALAPAELPAPRPMPARSRRRLAVVVGAAVVLLVVGIGAAFARVGQDDGGTDSAGAAALDPDTGAILESVELGSAPGTVAIGEGSVWVIDADDKTISQIDHESREVVRTFSTSSTPTDIAVGAGAVWVGNAERMAARSQRASRASIPTSSVLPRRSSLRRPVRAPPTGSSAPPSAQRIAVSPDAVWVVAADQSLYRIDPRTNKRVARIDGEGSDVATGEGDVWVTNEQRPRRDRPGAQHRGATNPPRGRLSGPLAIGGGAVWSLDSENEGLLRVDTDAQAEQTSVELGPWVSDVSFGEGAVWATSEIEDAVYRIDPRDVDTGAYRGDGTAKRGHRRRRRLGNGRPLRRPENAALPSSVCSDVYFEKAQASLTSSSSRISP